MVDATLWPNLWRKQILPLGTVLCQGGELDFTPARLAGMAAAFTSGTFDIVPFEDEAVRDGVAGPLAGAVRLLEVTADGMDAVIQVRDYMNTVLGRFPDLPVDVRIIDGRETAGSGYSMALAGVYVTAAPVLTGLRPWTREPVQ